MKVKDSSLEEKTPKGSNVCDKNFKMRNKENVTFQKNQQSIGHISYKETERAICKPLDEVTTERFCSTPFLSHSCINSDKFSPLRVIIIFNYSKA